MNKKIQWRRHRREKWSCAASDYQQIILICTTVILITITFIYTISIFIFYEAKKKKINDINFDLIQQ